VPQVPPVSGSASLIEATARIFDRGGALERVVPDYEPRAGQRDMADAVARAFDEGGILLVEAGTGTGKTLAYLAPAILSGQRVLVSTGTKNLQEQIFFKDLPILRDALGVPFKAAYMKGRANYLCLHRLDSMREAADVGGHTALPTGSRVFLPIVTEWAARTETGDRAELQDLPEDVAFWSDIAASAENCLGTDCPRYDDCFVTRMRQRAAESDLVVVNHHLLFADAAVRQSSFGEVIPACANLILDEAHQIEDVATQYFGVSVSNYRIDDVARDAERLFAIGDAADPRGEAANAIDSLRGQGRLFFGALSLLPVRDERHRLTADLLYEVAHEGIALASALDAFAAAIVMAGARARVPDPTWPQGAVPASPDAEAPAADQDLLALARRAAEIRDELQFLLRASDPDFVFYLERRGRGIFLRASPIDVSAIVRDKLLDRMRTTVLTSATLAVDGSLEYIRTRLGISRPRELRLASEFDYGEQAVLYLPRRMPDPRSPAFADAAAREILEILRRTEGRAFVLFTSYAMLRSVQAIAEAALPYPLFVQGAAPRTTLLRQFRATPNAVLLATASFWQGVDVMGEALSCVIVDKLPFASPADPVTAARIDAIAQRGGQAFGDYQVPLAILALQQGLGRLIRHRSDRGVLAVLDPRIRTMGYGRRFLSSLPPAPVTHELEDIRRFLARSAGNRPGRPGVD
jgi:ATP-dependent DNA helicase DinG